MSQAPMSSRSRGSISAKWLLLVVILPVAVAGLALRGRWGPFVQTALGTARSHAPDENADPDNPPGHPHAGHDHAHPGHDEGNSIEISEQARKNIGLKVAKVELKPFVRTISVPGLVVERSGRSTFFISAPLTGVVTAIYPTQGESVVPGQKLFEIRLTHEELVQSQADLLRTAEELDVVGREIARIEKLAKDGGLPGKSLLERQYEQQKQQAVLRAQKQALILHGLSEEQVEQILEKRTLLRTLQVNAPHSANGTATTDETQVYQVRNLNVAQGQHVNAGDPMAVLVDHAELFIEGNAFERDVNEINKASASDSPISATMEVEGKRPEAIDDLRIVYVAPQIEPDSRTLHFYVTLPNNLEQNKTLADGRRYISWRFRPGQRVQLQIPVETWRDRIVLPTGAVVEDGVENYVFSPNGDHFDRRAVHVEYRDQRFVVIANDGSLFPGDTVAISAAKQLQLAIKNKLGGGIDPHAGHNH